MPSATRRSILASLGTAGLTVLAGCGFNEADEPSAGSLQFVNEHELPHAVSMRVTGVGSTPGDGPDEVEGDPIVPPGQRGLRASTVVRPTETQTYEGVFTEPVWYGVEFTVDGELPDDNAGQVKYYPAPRNDEPGSVLVGKVYESGEFSWIVRSTADPGAFSE